MFRKLDTVLGIPTLVTTGGLAETAVTTTANNDSSAFADMRDYEQALLVLIVLVWGTTDTFTLTPLQATSAAGAGKKAIGSNTDTVLVASGTAMVAVTADEMDTDGGFRYVGMRAASDGTQTHSIVGLCIRGESKYAASTMPSL